MNEDDRQADNDGRAVPDNDGRAVPDNDGRVLPDGARHILVIDDDRRIRSLLSRFLSERGFRVSVARNGQDARNKLRSLEFDLLIMDVMMPGESGTDLTAALRAESQVPILMLTALGEVDARIKGLECGADDYLSKPFEPEELVLRIKAVLRRADSGTETEPEMVVFGPYRFSMVSRELRKNGAPVRLTESERGLLYELAKKPGEGVAREILGGQELEMNARSIDVQMNRLRRKIEDNVAEPVWLQTVRGVGYRLFVG